MSEAKLTSLASGLGTSLDAFGGQFYSFCFEIFIRNLKNIDRIIAENVVVAQECTTMAAYI